MALLCAAALAGCPAASEDPASIVAPAAPRPNVVLIVADDMGWSDAGSFGGEIETPSLDALARGGVRLTQFYTGSKCEPTRASLMSGRYWQDAGMGLEEGPTLAQVMRGAGYSTLAVGKWHLDGNPVERGFDRYFGHLSGALDYFKGDSSMRLDLAPFTPPASGFYMTDANADYAIRFIEQARGRHPDRPFFLYLAFNAPHAPLQAHPEDIARYRGRFEAGWDRLREARWARQKAMGLIRPEWELPPRPALLPAWESLDAAQREAEDLRMAIYAAMVHRMDRAIGRVLARIDEMGETQNTLVVFLSDNGANAFDRDRKGVLPEPDAYWGTGLGWAHLSNTPFRHYKTNVFNGGACAPFIASWPAEIASHGSISDEPAHAIDLMATLLDVSGGTWPAAHAGRPSPPLAGRSLRPVLAGGTREPHAALFFQLYDNRAVIAGSWKLASDWGGPWALFDLARDRTETHDLADAQADRVKQLEALWQQWWEGRPRRPRRLVAFAPEPSYRSPTSGGTSDAAGPPADPPRAKAP
jgi:arylsulfatase